MIRSALMFVLGVVFTAGVLTIAPVSARTQQGERDECVTKYNIEKLSPEDRFQLYESG